MIRFELHWPDRDLHPNARVHWSRKAKAVKRARTEAGFVARSCCLRPGDPDIPAAIKLTAVFHAPDRRHRDLDGMLSSMKSAFDGIADAIGVDDSKWQIAMRRGEPVKHGLVTIEIEEAIAA